MIAFVGRNSVGASANGAHYASANGAEYDSQGQVRSEAEHVAPGKQTKTGIKA